MTRDEDPTRCRRRSRASSSKRSAGTHDRRACRRRPRSSSVGRGVGRSTSRRGLELRGVRAPVRRTVGRRADELRDRARVREWRPRGDRGARDERRIGGGVHGGIGEVQRLGTGIVGPQPATRRSRSTMRPLTRGNSTSRSPMTRPLGWTSGGSAAAAWPRRSGTCRSTAPMHASSVRCLRRSRACCGWTASSIPRHQPGSSSAVQAPASWSTARRRRRRHHPRGRRGPEPRDPRVRRGGRLRPARHPAVRARRRRRAGDMGRGRSGVRGAQGHRPRRRTRVVDARRDRGRARDLGAAARECRALLPAAARGGCSRRWPGRVVRAIRCGRGRDRAHRHGTGTLEGACGQPVRRSGVRSGSRARCRTPRTRV